MSRHCKGSHCGKDGGGAGGCPAVVSAEELNKLVISWSELVVAWACSCVGLLSRGCEGSHHMGWSSRCHMGLLLRLHGLVVAWSRAQNYQ